eukprot:5784228-Lingulodinium_polyedra.AAC.1
MGRHRARRRRRDELRGRDLRCPAEAGAESRIRQNWRLDCRKEQACDSPATQDSRCSVSQSQAEPERSIRHPWQGKARDDMHVGPVCSE